MFHTQLPKGFRLATAFRFESALPYNITTGFDDNGDTVSNDRPAGVGRNSARGTAQMELGTRVSWGIGFGQRSQSGPQGPRVHIVRGAPGTEMLGSGPGVNLDKKRYGVEIYVQAYNALNRTNPLNFSGVLTSPFFGRPTAAAPPRRIEVGTRLVF